MCDTHYKNFTPKPGSCNNQEHKKWNRRSFLQALGIIGGGTVAFANTALSVSKPSPLSAALSDSESDRVLVIVRLKGETTV
ncbi:twin-arginine translocation signal domain-containing protein [Aquimarina sp. M1]